MSVIGRNEIENKLKEKELTITPILDKDKQVGECTIDLRLGTNFKVDLKTRQPYFDPLDDNRPIKTFFHNTYRNFGAKFLLYPSQLTLASTYEYIKIPENLFGFIVTRSSWNRLGLNVSSVIQPGYAGTVNLELMNNSSNPIALYPGLRFVQLFLFQVEGKNGSSYLENKVSKYVANSEPSLSNIKLDKDLEVLKDKFPINE